MFEERVNEAWEILSRVDNIRVTKPQGAFYMPVLFKDDALNHEQTLPIADPKVKKYIEQIVKGVQTDKRFVYYLLAATGICVVPLTGFCSDRKGFRVTLLETDDKKRKWTWKTIAKSIKLYTQSA